MGPAVPLPGAGARRSVLNVPMLPSAGDGATGNAWEMSPSFRVPVTGRLPAYTREAAARPCVVLYGKRGTTEMHCLEGVRTSPDGC